ncbi:Uncharacterized protein Fot_56825 [Forsythia ovata]|uniref:Uncharacterized protein n=1 Tax=Forsythia ovata TaxID=205694 RepID=A0ABD1NY07_9LAMI
MNLKHPFSLPKKHSNLLLLKNSTEEIQAVRAFCVLSAVKKEYLVATPNTLSAPSKDKLTEIKNIQGLQIVKIDHNNFPTEKNRAPADISRAQQESERRLQFSQ